MPTLRLPLAVCSVLTIASALSFVAAPALGAEDGPAAKSLLERLAALTKSAEIGPLESAIEEVPAVYKTEEGAAFQTKLRGALGKIAQNKKLGSARATAVRTLTELDDPKNAWKEIARLMPKPKVAEASDLDVEVVRAAGRLAQGKAAKPLLELVKKGKDAKLAAAAARALGGFAADVKGRVKILQELIALGKRLRPGESTGKAAGAAATERWGQLGPAITEGLNGLTGRELADFEAWEARYAENERKPKSLFPEE